MTTKAEEIRADLSGEELRCFDDHRRSLAAHILLRRGGRHCWAVATSMHWKRVRFALVQHASDWQLFWDCLPLAKWGFFRALSAPALAVDARFAAGRRVGSVYPLRLPRPRLYRPARSDLDARQVDGLYSEFMGLRA